MASSSERPLVRVYQLVGPDRADFLVLLIYASFVGLLGLAIPIAVQSLVGSVAFGALLQPIFVLSLLLLAGLTFSATVRGFETIIIERMQERLFARIALRYTSRLTLASSGVTEPMGREALLNRFFDVVTAHKALALLLADGLAIVLQTVIGLLALAFYHPWLLALGLVLTLALVFVLFGLGGGAIVTSLAESSAKYDLVAWLEELARHPALFRGAGSKLAVERSEQSVQRWLRERRSHFRVFFRQQIGLLTVQVLASAGLLLVGGVLVVARQLTLGQLVAAELIVSALALGIGKFAKSLDAAYDLATSAEKLAQVEEHLAPERTGTAAPAALEGGASLSLRGVSLTSEGRTLITDGELVVAPGERVAIIGASGSGKSALLDLLHGDWDGADPSGVVELDSVDLRAWRKDALRSRAAIVRSGGTFAGTVLDNVSLGRDGLGPVEVQRALEAVGAWDAIAAQPQGIEQRLRPCGAPLSRGEALLVVLARALASDARLLLVDSLAELDPDARAIVLARLHDRSRPMSVLFVASDIGLVGPCDRVYRLTRGVLAPEQRRMSGVAA